MGRTTPSTEPSLAGDIGLIVTLPFFGAVEVAGIIREEMACMARENAKPIRKIPSVGYEGAETLVDALANHPGVMAFDRQRFIDAVANTDVPGREGFYKHLPSRTVDVLHGDDFYSSISLDFILRNSGAANYQMDVLKRAFETVFLVPSPSRIRKGGRELAKVMAESPYPLSLLGTMETHDYTVHGMVSVTKSPVLAVPEARNMEMAVLWEARNTKHYCVNDS